MINKYSDFLLSKGAALLPHSGRKFIDHLRGTYNLLDSWGCVEDVCLAGLFHSIYGTNVFDVQSVSFNERASVKDQIGEQAEYLAYLFCISTRPLTFLNAISSGTVQDRFSFAEIVISSDVLVSLVTIEAANLIEQGSGRSFFHKLLPLINNGKIKISPIVTASINDFCHSPKKTSL